MNPLNCVVAALAVFACTVAASPVLAQPKELPKHPDGRIAPLLDGMGKHTHEVTTKDEMAQKFFNQGLVLAYAFNHAEAERSFLEVARRDPNCMMAYWGAALVLGPNINAKMMDDVVPKAWDHLKKAEALRDKASPRERDYLDALKARYSETPVKDRAPLDSAYADAMRKLVEKHPDDLDAKTLLAEALMNLHPWDFWQKDGQQQPWTQEILTLLETVLAKDPEHPGANHLYIHAVEASRNPERGIVSADRLRDLVPGAGHLVHMPAHIYIRIGKYHDCTVTNQRAHEADDKYIAQCHAQGLYQLAYMPHNEHFVWFGGSFEGRSELAIEAARHISNHVNEKQMREEGFGFLQQFWITPIFALVQFGRWDEILKLPEPEADLIYPRSIRHFARGMALARKKQFAEAEKELAALTELSKDESLKKLTTMDINNMFDLVAIAREQLAGELAFERGDLAKADEHLTKAVALQDALRYDEPESWYTPVRLALAVVKLKAGKPAAAEQLYQQDLLKHPDNGWALFGLVQALKAQGHDEDAAEAQRRFDIAWSRADVKLPASRF